MKGKEYEFELEGPWSRVLVGIFDILLGWCFFWSCRADLDAQANGRALERIEKRLDAAAGGQARRGVTQRGRENGVEDLSGVTEHESPDPALPLVERRVSAGREAGADEDGLILPEGVRLPPLDQPAPLQNPGGLGIGPAELDIAGSGVDPFENSVMPSVHGDNSTTNRAEGAATN